METFKNIYDKSPSDTWSRYLYKTNELCLPQKQRKIDQANEI